MHALESPGRALMSFNSSTTISLYDIMFFVSIGLFIMMVKFSVVEDPSSYNAILDRP